MDYDRMFDQEDGDAGVAHFIARYDSECACGKTICAGDRAGYINGDDVASCAECCGLD